MLREKLFHRVSCFAVSLLAVASFTLLPSAHAEEPASFEDQLNEACTTVPDGGEFLVTVDEQGALQLLTPEVFLTQSASGSGGVPLFAYVCPPLTVCDCLAKPGTSCHIRKQSNCSKCSAAHCDGCCKYFNPTAPAALTACCAKECGTVC